MITVIPRRYDAPKWQANVPTGQVFKLNNGQLIHNLFELKQVLSSIDETLLQSHVNPEQHDLAAWVLYSFGDPALSEELKKNHHRWGLIVTLERQLMRTLNLPPF